MMCAKPIVPRWLNSVVLSALLKLQLTEGLKNPTMKTKPSCCGKISKKGWLPLNFHRYILIFSLSSTPH
jgi:hypothetical protein